MNVLTIVLQVLVALTSVLLALTVLLHKGRGGGISDMFGGGMTSSLGSSGSAEKTLTTITVWISVIWIAGIIGLALLMRFNPTV